MIFIYNNFQLITNYMFPKDNIKLCIKKERKQNGCYYYIHVFSMTPHIFDSFIKTARRIICCVIALFCCKNKA